VTVIQILISRLQNLSIVGQINNLWYAWKVVLDMHDVPMNWENNFILAKLFPDGMIAEAKSMLFAYGLHLF